MYIKWSFLETARETGSKAHEHKVSHIERSKCLPALNTHACSRLWKFWTALARHPVYDTTVHYMTNKRITNNKLLSSKSLLISHDLWDIFIAEQHNRLQLHLFYLLICKYRSSSKSVAHFHLFSIKMKKSRICKQLWSKPYYLAQSNIQISWNMNIHISFRFRFKHISTGLADSALHAAC